MRNIVSEVIFVAETKGKTTKKETSAKSVKASPVNAWLKYDEAGRAKIDAFCEGYFINLLIEHSASYVC